VVVLNDRTSVRLRQCSCTRTQATTVSRWTSIPQHREYNTSITHLRARRARGMPQANRHDREEIFDPGSSARRE